jgi:hypothetical protein
MPSGKLRQSIRIPAGWVVQFNDWHDVDVDDQDAFDWLKEDLIQIRHVASGCLVDVGWYGGSGSDGAFVVQLIGSDLDWDKPLAKFRLRDRLATVAALEKILDEFRENIPD